MTECVYVFDFGSRVKVGFSTNVEKRLRQVENSSGEKANDVFFVEAKRKTEKLAHNHLNRYRTKGEFFRCSFDLAKAIVSDIVSGKITEPLRIICPVLNKGHIAYNKLFKLLDENGFNSYKIKQTNLMGQATFTALKNGTGGLDSKTIARLCAQFNCQPGDIMEYIPEKDG